MRQFSAETIAVEFEREEVAHGSQFGRDGAEDAVVGKG